MRELQYLSPEEVTRLFSNLRRREDRLFFKLLWILGDRVSENLALRPMDFDFAAKRVNLPALKRKDMTRKDVALYDSELLEELREFVRGKPRDKPIFTFTRQTAYMRIAMAGVRAGFSERIFPHLLRHSMAIHWSKCGGNLQLLQRQLGHKSLFTTANMYQRFQTSDILKEAERIFSK